MTFFQLGNLERKYEVRRCSKKRVVFIVYCIRLFTEISLTCKAGANKEDESRGTKDHDCDNRCWPRSELKAIDAAVYRELELRKGRDWENMKLMLDFLSRVAALKDKVILRSSCSAVDLITPDNCKARGAMILRRRSPDP